MDFKHYSILHINLADHVLKQVAVADVKDFDRFVTRETGQCFVDYLLEPELDALSVEVVYENGCSSCGLQ